MYLIRNLKDFLPLFQNQPMKLKLGERFHYNNAGYILLGLIVEQASQLKFSEYIEENIFKKAGMNNSGYFEFDSLPRHTALGYIDLPNGKWKTNIYSLPVKGGSDGGAYVTVNDMVILWDSLINNQLLNEEHTKKLLTPYVRTNDKNGFYGYGLWIEKDDNEIFKYHIMGYDPGVNFHSAFYPKTSIKTVICSNKSQGALDIMREIEEEVSN
jgi:CubicO group peptidase (beta-lactamase class C family)